MSVNQVQNAFITDGSITTTKIADGNVTPGKLSTGAPSWNTSGTVSATTFSGNGTIPVGGIIMWSGTIANIPTGWALCNGQNGTPNLQDRFIVGAGSGYSVANIGGSKDATLVSHSHTATSTVNDPTHNHIFPGDDQLSFANGKAGWTSSSATSFGYDAASNPSGAGKLWYTTSSSTGITVGTSVSTEGSSATNANLPPYYALAFIMRTV